MNPELVAWLLISVAIGVQVGIGSRNLHYALAAQTFSFVVFAGIW